MDARTLAVVAVVAAVVAPTGVAALAADPGAATAATTATQANESADGGAVNVTVGQQLSTVLESTESDVGAEVEHSSFEASLEGADEAERAEAVAERAAELREEAREIRAAYREATEAYEAGEITREEYARRLAVLNARAENLLENHERLQRRAANVSDFDLAAAGLNRTALAEAVEDVESVSGAGPSALLERFTGQREGSVEVEYRNGLEIEVESEDGERSREVERPRDDVERITVPQDEALATARETLSDQDGRWVLVRASVHPESGYYKFRFRLAGANESGEAEVRVDGSTGEVFRLEEEFEARDDADDESTEVAIVVVEGTPAPGATVTVQVLADGEPASGHTVYVNGEAAGTTGPNGTVDLTLPAGEVEVSAEAGDEDAELEFEFADDGREALRNVSTEATIEDGTVTVTVRHEGSPVANVTVTADGERVGTTGPDGTVTFETDAEEDVELTFRRGELEFEVEYAIVDGSLVPVGQLPGDRPGPGLEELELSVVAGAPGPGETVTLLTTDGDGDPANASVYVNGRPVGDTGADGRIEVTFPDAPLVRVDAIGGYAHDEETFEFDREVDDLEVVVVGEPAPGEELTVQVLADGDPVGNATVSVNGDDVAETAADGTATVTLPESGDVRIEAETGGESARVEFEFETGDDALNIAVVSGDPAPGATITVKVTEGGDPVPDAAVTVDGEPVGLTDTDGTIEVTLPEDEDDPRVRARTDDGDARIEFDFESEDEGSED